VAKQGDGWLSREMGGFKGDWWLSRKKGGFQGRCVAKLVARLLAKAALISLKNTKWAT
jgi:hypothetical protein